MKITKSQIVATALDLLNEIGLDALTTRKLAERLGVQQPTLYWHFATRTALLAALNAEILARGPQSPVPKPGDDWQSFLTRNGLGFRAALLAYRDGARIHAGAPVGAADPAAFEMQLRFLVAQGLSLETALYLGTAIERFTTGCVLNEQAGEAEPQDDIGEDFPMAAEARALMRRGGAEAAYRQGLRLLLDGADLTMDS